MLGGATAVLAAMGLTAFALTHEPTVGTHEGEAVSFEVGESDGGVYLSMSTTFPDDVTLSSPSLRAGDASGSVWLWPLDGADHEGEDLDPLPLTADTGIQLAGGLQPDCGDPAAAGEVLFTVRVADGTGEERVVNYVASNTDDVESAFDAWCRRPPQVDETGFRMQPNGALEMYLSVVNPGPETITVETPAIADEHVTWTAASIDVPAGETGQLTIFGRDVGCEPGEVASWRDGRLLVDGEPYRVESTDAWC